MGWSESRSVLVLLTFLAVAAPSGAWAPTDDGWAPADGGPPDGAALAGLAPTDPLDALALALAAAGRPAPALQTPESAPDLPIEIEPAYTQLVDALGLPRRASGLPGHGTALEPILAALLHDIARAAALRETAMSLLPPSDLEHLLQLDAAYRASRATGDRTTLSETIARDGGMPDSFDGDAITASAAVLIEAGLRAGRALQALGDPDWPAIDAALPGCTEDPAGVVVVCGRGDDVMEGTFVLELDLGGDDVHRTNAGSSGIGVLFPGPNGLPVALALDVAGNDIYEGGSQVQGTGTSSPGVLIDLEGHDTYHASAGFFTFAQGAGHLGGVGLLYDAVGDDHYHATGSAWDTQGFGILGGAGVLFDASGNDRYGGGVFAQGAGDFNAVGLLVDASGWDTYAAASRWSQGFGDGAGAGWLWDVEGNDAYTAGVESQGAGVGGTGVLLDTLGSDDYAAGERSQGWANEGPTLKVINDVLVILGLQVPGTGLLFDGHGQDSYTGPGCNLCVWTGGSGGVGIDNV